MEKTKILYLYEKNPIIGKIKYHGSNITYKKYVCYNIETKDAVKQLSESELLQIFIFKNCNVLNKKWDKNIVEIGPIKTVRTAWSTNVESVCLKSGIDFIEKIEKTTCYFFKDVGVNLSHLGDQLFKNYHDKMTEEIYTRMENKTQHKNNENGFQNKIKHYCERFKKSKCKSDILEVLREVNKEYGLSLSHQDIIFFLENAESWENPLFMILDLAQSNSEHCRHHFFNGHLIIDRKEISDSLFDIVKKPLKMIESMESSEDQVSLVAFSDNSSVIRGYTGNIFIPDGHNKVYTTVSRRYDFLLTAETHNFPTAIAPFQGAATGIGGRIRDSQSTGKGSIPIASSAGYCVGDIYCSDSDVPSNIATPVRILIEASNGASDYGNKFGEPIILGFTRSFKYDSTDWGSESIKLSKIQHKRIEWLKPIMFTGGLGLINSEHLYKDEAKAGLLVAKIGGPAYRIGIGGGAASSRVSESGQQELDFSAVQRGDPEMAQRMNRVIRCCVEMGKDNPILSIHDQGAGGNGNVLKEIIDGKGAVFDLSQITLGDKTMSDIEIWLAEYQESNAILIKPEGVNTIRTICNRENVNLDIVGQVTDDVYINIYNKETNIIKNYVHKDKVDKRKYYLQSPSFTYESTDSNESLYSSDSSLIDVDNLGSIEQFNTPTALTESIELVLSDVAVGSKRFLTNKVDRSVSGLIAQQQCVGTNHTPLSNFGLISQGYFPNSAGKWTGCVTAIGEQPISGLIDPISQAHKTFGEAITNLMWCAIDGLSSVRCSANWMWPMPNKDKDEGYKMYQVANELSKLMCYFGMAIDGGKDSLSMAVQHNDTVVKSPGSLVLSLYARCPDIYKKVTPDVKVGSDKLYFVDLARGHQHLSGSILHQRMGYLFKTTNTPPLIRDQSLLMKTFDIVQKLIKHGEILAGHDRSDGGLFTTVFEMCMASECGFIITVPEDDDLYKFLFNEELGLVIQVRNPECLDEFTKEGIDVYPIADIVRDSERSSVPKVEIYQSNKTVLTEHYLRFKKCWELPSYFLEKKQCNSFCVEEEYLNSLSDLVSNSWSFLDRSPETNFSVKSIPEPCEDRNKYCDVNVAIVREEGSNSDREMAAAFYHVGARVTDVTTTELLEGKISLQKFNGLVFVGGFSFADVLGSGTGWAATLEPFIGQLGDFFKRKDTFTLGVCNGCQLMVKLLDLFDWLDIGLNRKHEEQHVGEGIGEGLGEGNQRNISSISLETNRSDRFESRFPILSVNNTNSVFFSEMKDTQFGIWSAHKEGRFVIEDTLRKKLVDNGMIPVQYSDKSKKGTTVYPQNPNGSVDGIAAIQSRNGRHMAIMPHPERSFLKWQIPWLSEKDSAALENTDYTPWFSMFKNAVDWVKNRKTVLVLGSGAREHALVEKLTESSIISRIYVSPGNMGMQSAHGTKVECVSLPEFSDISAFCKEKDIKTVVVGPEQPLVNGVVDYLANYDIKCFGPNKHASQIEGSKAFSKKFMKKHGIPTANFASFDNYEDCALYLESLHDQYIKEEDEKREIYGMCEDFSNRNCGEDCDINPNCYCPFKWVIKVSGLAAGKGVVLPKTFFEAYKVVKDMMVDKNFGDAGNTIVIEDTLYGEEVSVFGFCNGKNTVLMPQAQDNKRIWDDDYGLNTGGMGAYAPVSVLTDKELDELRRYMDIVVQELGYVGVLYAGVMKTVDGIFMLEFNCRFGDPEAQVVLNLLDSDLGIIVDRCVNGQDFSVSWKDGYATNVVLSHVLYPEKKLDKAVPIRFRTSRGEKGEGIHSDIKVYWASICKGETPGIFYTKGGRVASIVAYGNTLYNSVVQVYNNIYKIDYDGAFYRRDIGFNYIKKTFRNPLKIGVDNNDGKKLRIGILGSTNGTSTQTLLECCGELGAEVGVIITNRSGAGIIDKASSHRVPFMFLSAKGLEHAEYDNRILQILSMHKIDIVFLVGYMKIVSPVLVEAYKGRMFNIHPSLLPKFGGKMDLDVHLEVINAGEYSTGCTLHEVSNEVDGGKIVMQKQIFFKQYEDENIQNKQLKIKRKFEIDTKDPNVLKRLVQNLEKETIVDFVKIYRYELWNKNYNNENRKITYKDSGVDIDKADEFVKFIKTELKKNNESNHIGGFGGIYEINGTKLCATTDGVGTKLEIAQMFNKFDTIGIDLVAMCVNDLIVQGAEPLFFLDYIAVDKIDLEKCSEIMRGIIEGCKQAGCKLLGGETAEMPGIYPNNGFDLAGFSVGIIPSQELELPCIDEIQAGDKIIGIPSSGIHSNGYSLVRKILEKHSCPNPEQLLIPTKIYVKRIKKLREKYKVKALAHITGGGLTENIPRILPNELTPDINLHWKMPNIFYWIQEKSGLSDVEMMRTFNCGIGMVIIVEPTSLIFKEDDLLFLGEVV